MISLDKHYQGLKDARIMIVDDEPINIEVVQAFLEEEKYHDFVAVEDSTQAMQILEETRPDLLLLDLMMPEVSGFDILAAVRAHPLFQFLPVIILTASTDMENRLKALDLGATDFLAKPLDQSELGLRVRNTLAAKAYQDQLAFYDALTKLPNRHLFMEDLSRALKITKRYHEKLALLSIEIDNFAKVNDTIGLNAGDEVLRLVAHRIQQIIREGDVLSRAASDEVARMALFHLDSSVFSLIIDRMTDPAEAALVARRIIKKLRTPLRIGEDDVYLTASVGIATCPPESDDASELLRLAASAKDYTKKMGGDAFHFSSKAISTMYRKRMKLESKLRDALKNQEFVLYYQPKVDLQTGVVQGVEALIRWRHNGRVVSPDVFIPLAEETGIIVPLGEWVLSEACRQLKEWQRSQIPINIAVNISARQFASSNFQALVEKTLHSSGIDACALTLELTETLLLGNIEDKLALMKRLKAFGLKLSIDDFGTGYSSLSYLKKLPLDELKIDRSFIKGVANHADSRAIVSAIVSLARSLKLSTVAEGIETKEELEILRKLGCTQYQGFLFSPPVPAKELMELLSQQGNALVANGSQDELLQVGA